MLIFGTITGRLIKRKNTQIKGLGKIQTVLIMLLIFLIGARIGSDERLIDSVGTIGVSALVVTIATMCGSVLAIFVMRKCLKIDRKGDKAGE